MIQVAKITPELATQVAGTLSNDGIRFFNPVLDLLGNWIMDLQMAIDNDLEYEIFDFTPEYIEELGKISNNISK